MGQTLFVMCRDCQGGHGPNAKDCPRCYGTGFRFADVSASEVDGLREDNTRLRAEVGRLKAEAERFKAQAIDAETSLAHLGSGRRALEQALEKAEAERDAAIAELHGIRENCYYACVSKKDANAALKRLSDDKDEVIEYWRDAANRLKAAISQAIESAEEEGVHIYRGTDEPRRFVVVLREAVSGLGPRGEATENTRP